MKSLDVEIKPLGRERDMQIAEIKRLYHERNEYKLEGASKPFDVRCVYCGDRKLKREVCQSRVRKWSSSRQSVFILFDELPIKKSYKVYINEYNKEIHEIKIPSVFPHMEFKGDSFQDAVTQAYIFYKEKESK